MSSERDLPAGSAPPFNPPGGIGGFMEAESSGAEHYVSGEPLLRFFSNSHLQEGPLKETSRLFAIVARKIVVNLPRSPERTVALRKLLESKDAAVRAALDLPGV